MWAGTKRTICHKRSPEGWELEEVEEADMEEKNHLGKLAIFWDNTCESCSSAAAQEVLEVLEPSKS